MKFRTILLVSVAVLIGVIVAATVGSVAVLLQSAARQDLVADLERSKTVFAEVQAANDALHRSESRVVAEEPRLKAVVATEEVTHETVLGVAFELKKALQSDLFLITDGGGRLLADVADPSAAGFDMKEQPLVAAALAEGEKTGIWTHDGSAYQVVARRLAFGTTVVGVLVIGYKIDDRLARAVFRQSGSEVAVSLEGKPVARSEALAAVDAAAVAQALAGIPGGGEPVEVTVGDTHYLAAAGSVRSDAATPKLSYVVLRSLDRALAPARSVARVLYGIALAALIGAVFLTVALSRRLSKPLDSLVAFTNRIGKGALDEPAEVSGPIEVQTLGRAMNRMVVELGESRKNLAAKERLERELEIGANIQTSILPRDFDIDGLEIDARMLPASEVGGDYYDVFPVEGGCWIGIGDVAGHGLTAGLIMLMVQSIIAALARDKPLASPATILRSVNRVLFENIRYRLRNDEHVTLSLMRYHRDGRFVFAGAHEEIIVCRAKTGRCELIQTPGTWLGAMGDVAASMVDGTLTLEDGDVMVLYTDGITEAMGTGSEQYGLERFCSVVEKSREKKVSEIRAAVLRDVNAFMTSAQDDDMTLVVVRYGATSRR